jgi:hypothetical protein
MSAQPVHELDPDDPVEILGVLPVRFHDQFLREYHGAAARRPVRLADTDSRTTSSGCGG